MLSVPSWPGENRGEFESRSVKTREAVPCEMKLGIPKNSQEFPKNSSEFILKNS